MKTQQRSLRISLFLALALFGGLIYYTSMDRTVDQSGFDAQIGYGMDVELKWIAEADQADYVVVQETLSHYASLLGLTSGAQSSRFQLDHCCDQAGLLSSLDSQADFYHLSASLDFEAADSSAKLLRAMVDQGYLELGAYTNFYGMLHGEAAMHLPIAGSSAQVLHIRNSSFQVNLVPRVASILESNPEV